MSKLLKNTKNLLLFIGLLAVLPSCHKKPQEKAKVTLSHNEPITVYSHGYMSNKWIANIFHTSVDKPSHFCKNAFIIGPMESFNYADWFNPLATHLGQDVDIQRLHEQCKDLKKVILVGVSRGASAIINYLAVYKPTNIIAAVVESPFDHFENVADHVLHRHGFNDIDPIKNKLRPLFFHNYKKEGLQPITSAANVPHNIPLLIISSAQDTLIPEESTINVFNALREAGHNKVYLLKCEFGSHGKILWGKEGKIFRDVVHAFYKQHSAPYYAPWAQAGNERFKACPGYREDV